MTTEARRQLEGLPRSMLAQGKNVCLWINCKAGTAEAQVLKRRESPDATFAMYSYLEYYKK